MNIRLSRLLIPAALLLVATAAPMLADSDLREWSLANRGKITGSLVEVDEAADTVRLRHPDGTFQTYNTSDFADLDRAWLAAWAEKNAELDEVAKKAPGKLTRHVVVGEFSTEYYVYEPSNAGPAESRPVLILFNPAARAQQYIKSFIEPAEETKMVIITLGYFHSVSAQDEMVHVKEASMSRRFGEVWRHIQKTVQLDPAQVFLGGTSGGAQRAYSYVRQHPHPWAGIWSNGGVIGSEKRPGLSLPQNMRVVIVNGSQDHDNNRQITQDTSVLQAQNAMVGVISFEGAHQMPPKHKIAQSIDWLLGKEDTFQEE